MRLLKPLDMRTRRLSQHGAGGASEGESCMNIDTKALRKKLAALSADVQIRVSRNAGYSLEEKP